MRKVAAVSAVAAVADVLREAILDSNEECPHLGLEDDLLARLGVSRPTLRQAIRVLQAEGILTVRRGHGGGLYGRRPTAEGVAHTATVFLRSRRTPFADIVRTHSLIVTEAARLAALNPDAKERARLVEFVDTEASLDRRDHARARAEWGVLLSEIARSPTLQLFDQVLGAIAEYPMKQPFRLEPHEIARTREHWRMVAEAVRDGDAGRAVAVSEDMARALRAEMDSLAHDPLGW